MPLYVTCVFLMKRPFNWYQTFDLMTLTVTFDLYLANLNLVIKPWSGGPQFSEFACSSKVIVVGQVNLCSILMKTNPIKYRCYFLYLIEIVCSSVYPTPPATASVFNGNIFWLDFCVACVVRQTPSLRDYFYAVTRL